MTLNNSDTRQKNSDGLVETMNDNFRFAPAHGPPIGVNDHCKIGCEDELGGWISKKRGVAIYGDPTTSKVVDITEFPKIEAVVSIHQYSGSKYSIILI